MKTLSLKKIAFKGTHGYNSQYHHKPEVCHYENHKKCMEEHKNVCHYKNIDVPHKEPQRVPEQICSYKKHHTYGKPIEPESSWGPLDNPNYQDKGQVVELRYSGMNIYHTGKEFQNITTLYCCLQITFYTPPSLVFQIAKQTFDTSFCLFVS